MQREKVGIVTEDEKKEILRLNERKNALKELYITLTSPYLSEEERKNLYELMISNLEDTIYQFDSWWREMPKKYNWKSKEDGYWTINFETNEIYLEAQEGQCCEKVNNCSER